MTKLKDLSLHELEVISERETLVEISTPWRVGARIDVVNGVITFDEEGVKIDFHSLITLSKVFEYALAERNLVLAEIKRRNEK